MSNPIIDFSHLTPAERIELAEQLWDSLEPQNRADLGLSDEQVVELRRRRAALDLDGDPGEPWEAALDRIESGNR
ncbi:MAG TPA: addiction module protein [Longimicrobium sp.]|jgi:putative addiction module component (TIGR02574 family)